MPLTGKDAAIVRRMIAAIDSLPKTRAVAPTSALDVVRPFRSFMNDRRNFASDGAFRQAQAAQRHAEGVALGAVAFPLRATDSRPRKSQDQVAREFGAACAAHGRKMRSAFATAR